MGRGDRLGKGDRLGEGDGSGEEAARQALRDNARCHFIFDQQARGVAAGRHAEAFSRRVGVRLDGAFADVEYARDLLRLQMAGDEPQNLFLALGQCVDARSPVPQSSPRAFGVFTNETRLKPLISHGFRHIRNYRLFQRVFPVVEGYPQRRGRGRVLFAPAKLFSRMLWLFGAESAICRPNQTIAPRFKPLGMRGFCRMQRPI